MNSSVLNLTNPTTIIAAVDAGMGYTKVKYGYELSNDKEDDKVFMFRSAIKMDGDSIGAENISINGEAYEFETCKELAYQYGRSKNNKVHYKLMQYSLYKIYLETGVKKFYICYGVSIDTFINKKITEDVINDILLEKEIIFEKNGESVTLTIEGVVVKPETLSNKVFYNSFVSENRKAILDIGTKNIQISVFENGRFIRENIGYLGYEHILKGFTKYLISNSSEIEVPTVAGTESYLQNGFFNNKSSENDRLFEEYINKSYSKSIEQFLYDSEADKYTEILFIGGTSKKIYKQLKPYISNKSKLASNAEYANVNSLYYLALLALKKNEFYKEVKEVL